LVGSVQGAVSSLLLLDGGPRVVLINSEFYGMSGAAIRWGFEAGESVNAPGSLLAITNCVALARSLVTVEDKHAKDRSVELHRNTFISGMLLDAIGFCKVTTRAVSNVLNIQRLNPARMGMGRVGVDYVWQGERNLYRDPTVTLNARPQAANNRSELANRLAQSETNSWMMDLDVGQNIRARADPSIAVRPVHFQLPAPTSGLPAGLTEERLRQLGASIEDVGPGRPYATFRASEGYARWRMAVGAAAAQ
jgi:hypothetical protein